MSTRPMSRLERFIGTWNTTGDVLETEAGPATTLAATDIYRWLPGRHFIVHEVDARFGDSPARSMESSASTPRAGNTLHGHTMIKAPPNASK